jgi:diguanylate cyclase (GGDEF)-like protein
VSNLYEPAADAFRPVAEQDARQAQALQDASIMIVDDEPMMIEVTQTYLEDAGYSRFVSVTDPRLALATARVKKPGLILLDLMMPGMSGFDVLQLIRRDDTLRYTPVIVLTAASDPASKLRALELGATEFLAKPVDESELKIRVRNSLAFKVYQDRLANDDPLTGLPNRRVFGERLKAAMAYVLMRKGRHLALMHLNVDRFRQVNDTLGHKAGDELLAEVAVRLRNAVEALGAPDLGRSVRPPVLARIGGDEFGVLLPDIDGPAAATEVARELLTVFTRPFRADGQDLIMTASIGIAMHPAEARDDATLLRNAGVAMKHAKASTRNGWQVYSDEINNVSRERLKLEMELRKALERQELRLHYQPKVDLATGRVSGCEALMRWAHPELGMLPPGRFIPIAEETGLIVEMGEWVIREACQQIERWRRDGLSLPVSVNVARHGLASGNLASVLSKALQEHQIPTGLLVLELTESMLMDQVDTMARRLRQLREMGVELSIDDFGTGYSSMSYLKQFPVQELKIDRSFVTGAASDKTDAAIVRALIVLGHSLGMRVVAEGVETEAQRDALRLMRCDSYQGFLCSPAIPPGEMLRIVAASGG